MHGTAALVTEPFATEAGDGSGTNNQSYAWLVLIRTGMLALAYRLHEDGTMLARIEEFGPTGVGVVDGAPQDRGVLQSAGILKLQHRGLKVGTAKISSRQVRPISKRIAEV